MSVVTRRVRDVIRRAYDILGIIGENISMSGYQEKLGLDVLNEVLDTLSSGGITIPSYTEFNFPMVAGEPDYKIGPQTPASNPAPTNLIEGNRILELVSVQLKFQRDEINPAASNTSLYPVRVVDINSIDQNQVVTTSAGRPKWVALTRWFDDGSMPVPFSRLSFYPYPDQAYTIYIRAKSYINYLSTNDIMNEIPANMHMYLSYELAYHLQNFYESANWTPQKEMKYQELKDMLTHSTDIDLTLETTSILDSKGKYYSRRLLDG